MATSVCVLTPDYLLKQSRWIRDSLDPQVAKDGPDALHSDEILTLDEFLRHLLESDISLDDIRYSRMHKALLDISGRATRWPKKIIHRSDALQDAWVVKYGSLRSIGIPLYGPTGRLHGICEPDDLKKDSLIAKWLKSHGAKLSPSVARKTGDLGFKPGEWWISPLFAYRAGIIDSANLENGIVSDSNGAYAVIMTNGDEVTGGIDPNSFQYLSKAGDPGRYRLTAGTPESRHPVRILRHHSLHSLFKPRAGLRYDGLHKVAGWTIHKPNAQQPTDFIIHFKRLLSEPPMSTVLARPYADEVEDYVEYKQIRQRMRVAQSSAPAPAVPALPHQAALDGTARTDSMCVGPLVVYEAAGDRHGARRDARNLV